MTSDRPTQQQPEPGTGPDWINAKVPAGMRPVGPRSTQVRAWDSIAGDDVPTDAEVLAHLDAQPDDPAARAEAAELRRRAAAGYHDGSLPQLGAFRPVYIVPAEVVPAD